MVSILFLFLYFVFCFLFFNLEIASLTENSPFGDLSLFSGSFRSSTWPLICFHGEMTWKQHKNKPLSIWTDRFLSINKLTLGGKNLKNKSLWLTNVKSCPKKCYAKELKSVEQKLTYSLFCLYWPHTNKKYSSSKWNNISTQGKTSQSTDWGHGKTLVINIMMNCFFRSWLFWFSRSVSPNCTTPDLIIRLHPLSKGRTRIAHREMKYTHDLSIHTILCI